MLVFNPSNSDIGTLIWHETVLGGGPIDRQLGYEGEDGISVLTRKERAYFLFLLSTIREYTDKCHLQTWKVTLITHCICQHHDFGLPSSRTQKNKFLLIKLPSLLDLVEQPELIEKSYQIISIPFLWGTYIFKEETDLFLVKNSKPKKIITNGSKCYEGNTQEN
jgi:hypothetical protein